MSVLVTGAFGPRPATRYGVRKAANEETRIPSIGFRPLSVYGAGRDFGLTAEATLAMKAAVLGRAFGIRGGGSTDLIHTDDVARTVVAAARDDAGARRDPGPAPRTSLADGAQRTIAEVAGLQGEGRLDARELA